MVEKREIESDGPCRNVIKCGSECKIKPTYNLYLALEVMVSSGTDDCTLKKIDDYVLQQLKDGADLNAEILQPVCSEERWIKGVLFCDIVKHGLRKSFEYALTENIDLNHLDIQNSMAECVFNEEKSAIDTLSFAKRLLKNGFNPNAKGMTGSFASDLKEAIHATLKCSKSADETDELLRHVLTARQALKEAVRLWGKPLEVTGKNAGKFREKARLLERIEEAQRTTGTTVKVDHNCPNCPGRQPSIENEG